VFIQSESELAAINMVFGASATGKRVMTSSSSPGISLMQEGISYLAGAELPAVIVNVMRGGPGLGNIAPAQGDYFQATRGGGHGDYRTIVLAPSTVQEMADTMPLAFDLADQYRIPVLILADGILGQMMEPVIFKTKPQRPLPPKTWALTGAENRPQNIIRSLWLKQDVLEKHNYKLHAKHQEIERKEILCEQIDTHDADIIIVAYGITGRIARGAIRDARDNGMKVGLIRPITLWPFPYDTIRAVAETGRPLLVVELSCGQMIEDVRLAAGDQCAVHFYGRAGGAVPTVDDILKQIQDLFVEQTK
jgi:2-oxoglutarate ferredoxin oxidoreductase subunit alpha